MTSQLTIPTDEMVEDYYASLMDAKTCERLGVTERAETNRKIVAIIEEELRRRGELHRIKGANHEPANDTD